MRALYVLSMVLFSVTASAAGAQILRGIPAEQSKVTLTRGYLKATPATADPLSETLDLWMTPPHSTTPIQSYRVEMTKQLHMVIVSDDFKTFLHVHPTLMPSGHFVLTQKFPAPGLYQVYADALPSRLDHQVFRFALLIGGSTASPAAQRDLPETGAHVQAGPYEVYLSTTNLRAGHMEMANVSILENGKAAPDLHPYLGAPAHAVFLNAKDLSYVHVHPTGMDDPMDMSKPESDLPANASVPSIMMLMVSIKEPGAYRLWLQFRGKGDRLYIAAFTVHAS